MTNHNSPRLVITNLQWIPLFSNDFQWIPTGFIAAPQGAGVCTFNRDFPGFAEMLILFDLPLFLNSTD